MSYSVREVVVVIQGRPLQEFDNIDIAPASGDRATIQETTSGTVLSRRPHNDVLVTITTFDHTSAKQTLYEIAELSNITIGGLVVPIAITSINPVADFRIIGPGELTQEGIGTVAIEAGQSTYQFRVRPTTYNFGRIA